MGHGKIATCLWFDQRRAREAAEFYVSVFPDSHMGRSVNAATDYPAGSEGDEITVEFTVLGMNFMGLNAGPGFTFNEAISFQVFTDSQEETDRYWEAITGNGGSESQCGWCKDRFGVSWQIVPKALMAAMGNPDRAAAKRGCRR